jgi:hypothetical protein
MIFMRFLFWPDNHPARASQMTGYNLAERRIAHASAEVSTAAESAKGVGGY